MLMHAAVNYSFSLRHTILWCGSTMVYIALLPQMDKCVFPVAARISMSVLCTCVSLSRAWLPIPTCRLESPETLGKNTGLSGLGP